MNTCLLKSKIFFFLCLIPVFFLAELGYALEEEIAKYPSRAIMAIHPYSAGTPADLGLRLISKEAEKFLGKPIVVINKPGGAGTIGTAAIAASKPDGYTIGNCQHSPMFVLPLIEQVPYHPLKDLKMILQYACFNIGVIVKADSPYKSLKDLIDYARQNPKKLTCGTAGVNSMQYLIIEQIAKKEKVQFTHIPFKSMPEIQTALLGGHVVFGVGEFNYSLLEAGQTRLLVLFREEPAEEYPGTPILKELGYDFPMPMPHTLGGPQGIPDEIVKKLEDAYTKAMKEPAFIKGMKELRVPIRYRNSKDLSDYVVYNYKFFEKLLKERELTK
jgi:tripartite-type tricarboxylate transporter receptor subunit TctC